MILKFWAFIYRTTGYYSNYATLKEYEVVKKVLDSLPSVDELKEDDMAVQDYVGLHIGLWQARNGFYRSMRRCLK